MRQALRLLARITKVADEQRQTVYLTHVKWVSGKTQLEKYFSQFGKVQQISMFYDEETGLHKGFASVTFANSDAATKAIQTRPHVIDGDLVGVELYIPLKNSKQKYKTM
jgi:RNA recognition motif-containing protein